MGRSADWTFRGDYIAKHAMTPLIANEALEDPDRLVLDPGPSSLSGRTLRVVGWSPTAGRIITVIVLPADETVNAWPSSTTDQRRYEQEAPDGD
ncbi:hypothetical protein MWU75_11040 [Ornithinimicrobium sp. F0845]|uniref:hypothetical protein n=1 Tax=Ornithinimicrobium sp. F0845 TaxID=2926412 RepID=UPI001FF2A0E2|nr:hypothetical protein [Ornithinimicrobium sp. F0845]MCK0112676.1 hypothetical protein [Ornithinimicrobium sp. F0845]